MLEHSSARAVNQADSFFLDALALRMFCPRTYGNSPIGAYAWGRESGFASILRLLRGVETHDGRPAARFRQDVRSDLPYTKRSGDMVYTSGLD